MEIVSPENSPQEVEEAAITNVNTIQATGSNFEITPNVSRQSIETPTDLESIKGKFQKLEKLNIGIQNNHLDNLFFGFSYS